MLMVAAAAAMLAPMLTYPFGNDQGAFADVADVIARGGVPYRDVWDIKTPGIYYLFWAIFAALGRSVFSVRLADVLWTLAAAAVVAAVGRRLVSRWAGIAGAFFFLVFYALGFDFWHTAQCDGFASLPLALAALATLVAESRHSKLVAVAAGILVGLTALMKFTLAAFLLVPIAAAVLSRDEPRAARLARCASYVGGCFLALGAAALLLWKAGALKEMIYIVFVWNSHYGRLQPTASKLLVIPFQLARFHLAGAYLVLTLAGALALVGVIDSLLRRRLTPHWWFLPAWWAIMLVGVCVQGKYFAYHWLPVLPPLGLLAGQGIAAIVGHSSRLLGQRAGRLSAVALALLLCCSFGAGYWKHFRQAIGYATGRISAQEYMAQFATPSGSYSARADLAVAEYVRSHTSARDTIFVWGTEPLIYFLSDRPLATRFIHSPPLLTPWSPPAWRQELIRDLQHRRPRLLLVVRKDPKPWVTTWQGDSASALITYPELVQFISANYDPAARIENFDIWQRR